MVGTPFDFDVSPALRPVRMARRVTGGHVGGSLIRLAGGTPRPVNMAAFYLTDPVRLATKPLFKYRHRGDEDVIAHVEAIDALLDRMGTYSGRTLAQLYHRFVTMNEIAGGTVTLGESVIDLADVRAPGRATISSARRVRLPRPGRDAERRRHPRDSSGRPRRGADRSLGAGHDLGHGRRLPRSTRR